MRDKWEEITPNGKALNFVRKAASCINYKTEENEYILIVGGKNALNTESREILIYNAKENSMEKRNNILPYKCSFNSNSFNLLVTGTYTNFTVDTLILQYDMANQIFFEINGCFGYLFK